MAEKVRLRQVIDGVERVIEKRPSAVRHLRKCGWELVLPSPTKPRKYRSASKPAPVPSESPADSEESRQSPAAVTPAEEI